MYRLKDMLLLLRSGWSNALASNPTGKAHRPLQQTGERRLAPPLGRQGVPLHPAGIRGSARVLALVHQHWCDRGGNGEGRRRAERGGGGGGGGGGVTVSA